MSCIETLTVNKTLASIFNRSKVGFKLQLGRKGFHIVILQCPKNVQWAAKVVTLASIRNT